VAKEVKAAGTTYTTINMNGDSAAPVDTVEVIEWDEATALRDPKGAMPWASWPFDMSPPSSSNITVAVVEAPLATSPIQEATLIVSGDSQ
jgi:hypothetical protein